MSDVVIYSLAAIGAVTVLTGLYRVRWLFDPKSWKRGTPFLGLPWGPG